MADTNRRKDIVDQIDELVDWQLAQRPSDESDLCRETVDDIEAFKQWEEEHSVDIPGNDKYRADVSITVFDVDSRVYMNISCRDAQRSVTAYLTPSNARRLSDLLLRDAASVEPR